MTRVKKTEESVTPKKRTRKEPAVKVKRDIPPNLLCGMCNNGQLSDSVGDFRFKYWGEPHVVTSVPCRECDSCGGRRYVSEDVMRPVAYMKANGHREVDYAEIMEIYWSWYGSASKI